MKDSQPQLYPPVPSYLFKVDEVPRSQVADVLRDRFSSNFNLLVPVESIHLSEAELMGVMVGETAMLRRRMDRNCLVRSPDLIRTSQLDHYIINLSLEQSGSKRHIGDGGRVLEQGVHELLIYDMGRPMRLDFSSGTDVSFIIPRDALDVLLPRRLDFHGCKPKGAVAMLLADYLRNLSSHAASMSQPEARLVSRSLLHMIAASVAPMADSMALARPELEQLVVRRIGCFIDQNLTDADLSVERICGKFQLSRSTLYRLFEPMGGVTSFVRARRLNRVHTLLTTSEHRLHLKRIAGNFGFGSAGNFSRVFREQYGYSPSEARQHAAPAKITAVALGPGTGHFAGWLRSLSH